MKRRTYNAMTDAQLVGRQVRLLRDLRRGDGLTAKAGRILTITRKYGGLALKGRGFSCTRVSAEDVELLPTVHQEVVS